MESGHSFTSAVLGVAWNNSRGLIRDRVSTGVGAAVSLAVGATIQYWFGGPAINIPSLARAFAYSAATAGILFGFKFAWHIFLAPSELVLKSIRPLLENDTTYILPRAPNYTIWKQRQKYSANELSALLVGIEPGGGANADYRSMFQLVLESLKLGEIAFNDPPNAGRMKQPGYAPHMEVEIEKKDALEWAEKKEFGKFVSPLL
jgi:hypothetical protein